MILDYLANDMSISDILKEYPGLEKKDIFACIAYGAEMSRDRYIELPAAK